MTLTFNDLYSSGNTPRVHGNGFVQLDIPGSEARLHIWPEQKLDTQKVYTGIHNHKFSFKSKILLGTLLHTQFDRLVESADGEYKIYKPVPRDREDKGLALITNELFNLSDPQLFRMTAGSEYEFKYGKFHDSCGEGLTVTLMEKTEVNDHIQVIVTCPKDKEPDNDFNRYQFEEEVLWPIIEDVFIKIKHIDI